MAIFKKIIAICLCLVLLVGTLASCDAGVRGPQGEQGVPGDNSNKDANNGSISNEDTTDGGNSTEDTNNDGGEESDSENNDEVDDNGNEQTPEDEPIAASGITLNKSEMALNVGESETLTATLSPAETTDSVASWISTIPVVATVENGLVTALSVGTTIIIATTTNGKTAMCTVTVSPDYVAVNGVTLNYTEAEMSIGDSLSLVATITPADATDKTVTWHSSDETVAKVVNGAVSALNMGTATITATASNGMKAQCVVTVKGNAVIQYERFGGFYIVTGIEGKTDKLEIPFLYDGLRVRAIKAGAFSGNSDLKEVILPNSLEYIYETAFMNCSNLEKINLPESLLVIGESAFENCLSLKEVTIPSLTETISIKAFYNCTALKAVTICEGVKHIGVSAFAKCSALETVTTSNGLETIDNYAFDSCTSLKRFEMPNTVEYLGDFAFRYAESMENITFSTKLTAIGIGCFQSCVSLDNVELHAGIVSFGESCFSWCAGMKSLRILGDVTFLGNSSFYECTGLENLYYASSISGDLGINNYIFYNAGTNGNGITFTLSPDACIPDRLFEPQDDRNRPKLVKLIVEDGATKVDYFQKYNTLPYLATIELPDTIKEINSGIFDNTAWYKAQPEGALYICNIFYGYKGTLTGELDISNDVVCIAFGALSGQNPTSLKIPFVGATMSGTANTHFGYVFGAKSTNDHNITIPYELTSVTVKKCQYTISSSAFKNCDIEVKIEHHWGDWKTTLHETCQSVGEEEKICSVCQKTETRERAVAHNWNEENTCATCAAYKDSGLKFKFDSATSTYYISDYTGTQRSVIIPSTYQSYPVTSIGERAFDGCSSLTSVTIPKSVTKIGNDAFYGCSSLESITIPFVGATKDGTSATHFGYIFGASSYSYNDDYVPASLKTVVITDATSIGKRAFYDCDSLTSITIPNSVTSIGDSAFDKCSSLTSIEIPNSVTSIGNYTFYECSSLTSIAIPNSVTSIGNSVFSGCSSLTAVYITDLAAWCGISFFGFFSSNPLCYAHNLYLNGELVTDLVIPDSVTSIGDAAFSGCSSLTSIEIPNSVTSIGDAAFEGCSSLTSVTIGNSVTSIGDYAFYDCSGLTALYINDLAAWCGISFDEYYSNPLYYAHNLYLNGELVTNLVIPDGVTSIVRAFEGCSSLMSVTIPNSVTSIGYSAFYNCSGLTSIEIPNSVTSIGGSAFYNCSGLTAVYITDLAAWCRFSFDINFSNPLYYAHNLYLNGELVTDLVIPDGVTSIGNYAFCRCSSLTSVTLPNSVTSIGGAAFDRCSSLTSVTIGNSVTSIGDWAFSGCSSLNSIELPNSVTSIGDSAFYICDSLTSVTFENTEGWTAGETKISSSDLANASTAAEYLNSTYRDYTWTRN